MATNPLILLLESTVAARPDAGTPAQWKIASQSATPSLSWTRERPTATKSKCLLVARGVEAAQLCALGRSCR